MALERVVLPAAGAAADLFYRRSRLGGEVPREGPLVLVANHPNGLVDPLLVARAAGRRIRFVGKAPLFEIPVIGRIVRGMRVLPVYRAMDGADTEENRATFAAVHEALAAGHAICLFPEGLSHDEPQVQRLKTGAARMALGAESASSRPLGVRIVPVGLVYRAKGRFRSRMAVWVGKPIDCADLRALHARDERAAVLELTDRIADGLRHVTIDLERWEDLPLLELAERIWRPGEGRRVARLSAMAEALRELRAREPERVSALVQRFAAFRARLDDLGIEPADLDVRYSPGGVARFAAREAALLLLVLPLAALGAALWWVPYRAVGWIARALRPEPALRATVILLLSLVLFPLWWALLVAVAAVAAGAPGGIAVALLAPPLGPLAIHLWERRLHALDDARVFLLALRRRPVRAELVRQRDALAAEIEALAVESGRSPATPERTG